MAFDDDLVYTENPSVQAGLRGIPRLLGSDAYAHLYESMGREQELSGGRYRPLSLVTFACEVQFFGTDPRIAHAGNVLLYALTCVLLFVVLRRTGWRSRGEERRERRGEGRSVGSQLLSWPFLAALLLYMNNQKKWLKELRNGWLANALLAATLLLFLVLALTELG